MTKKEYQELLKDPKWNKKRLRILKRDNFKCKKCSATEIELHVHHTFYIQGRKPWEYPDHCLITLCHICHSKEHEKPISEFIKPAGKKKGKSNKAIGLYYKKRQMEKNKKKRKKEKLKGRDKQLQDRYNKLRSEGKLV